MKKVSELVPKICSILNYIADKRIEDGNFVHKSQHLSDVTVKEQPGGVDKLLKTKRGPGPLGRR